MSNKLSMSKSLKGPAGSVTGETEFSILTVACRLIIVWRKPTLLCASEKLKAHKRVSRLIKRVRDGAFKISASRVDSQRCEGWVPRLTFSEVSVISVAFVRINYNTSVHAGSCSLLCTAVDYINLINIMHGMPSSI